MEDRYLDVTEKRRLTPLYEKEFQRPEYAKELLPFRITRMLTIYR